MTEVRKQTPGLESSLTSMDWLHTINVVPGLPNKHGKKEVNNNGLISKTSSSPAAGNSHSSDEFEHDETSQESPRLTGTAQHKDGKPPYSYANLITFAVNSTPRKMMTLCDIYQWIQDNFPYFKDAGNGWKVGVGRMLHITVISKVYV